VVALIPEGLKLSDNGTTHAHGHNLQSSAKHSVQGPKHLAPIVGLAELLHVAPSARLAPAGMKNIINLDHVSKETGVEESFKLKGLKACSGLADGQVTAQDRCPINVLTVDGQVIAVHFSKGRGVSHGGHYKVIGSLWFIAHNVCKGNSSQSPHLAKDGLNTGECAGGGGQIQGHDRGLGVLAAGIAILEGLLVHQKINVSLTACVSPILYFP
jgi:hypothetical protein